MANGILAMAERYRRPDWVRRLNAMAGSVGGDARRLIALDGPELLATAERSLDGPMPRGDLGDPSWCARFTSLVRALDAAPLTVVGRLMTRQELLRGLRTRLLATRAVDERPSIAREQIVAPMIVTGPARSGTSILFELLALDRTLRAPLACEALHPLPRRAPGDASGERFAWSECEQELWADVQPEFAAIHELRSDLPVECVTLTLPSFAGSHWMLIAAPGEGWTMDVAVNYEFERRILQLLQHGEPRTTWLLKTPAHLLTMEDLFAAFPDAWIVQTHRDPAKTIPSTVSTTAMVHWMRTEQVDAASLAQAILAGFAYGLNHSVELRSSEQYASRFVDVHFDELMRDPVRAVGRAYERMGRELTAEHAERIRAYLRDKPKGKFGTHQYAPEDWGFTASGLRADLKPYVDHFGVALEG